jgi:hypothetical protein
MVFRAVMIRAFETDDISTSVPEMQDLDNPKESYIKM